GRDRPVAAVRHREGEQGQPRRQRIRWPAIGRWPLGVSASRCRKCPAVRRTAFLRRRRPKAPAGIFSAGAFVLLQGGMADRGLDGPCPPWLDFHPFGGWIFNRSGGILDHVSG